MPPSLVPRLTEKEFSDQAMVALRDRSWAQMYIHIRNSIGKSESASLGFVVELGCVRSLERAGGQANPVSTLLS